MGFNVLIGGAVGVAAGACTIPFLGPFVAIPLITSLTGAGAGIGWKVSVARSVNDIDKSCREATSILNKAVEKVVNVY